jgi:hypothetical protein
MDVIRRLLRSSLLTELGDDEDRVGRVSNAAGDLAAELASRSRTLFPYAVVAAIDQSTPATATPIAAAEQALLSQWATFRNAFPKPPVEMLRAVTLAAVVVAVDADNGLKNAAWYTLRTVIESLPVGRWDALVTDLAVDWETKTRENIAAVWSPPIAPSRLRMPATPSIDLSELAVPQAHQRSVSVLKEYVVAVGAKVREVVTAQDQIMKAVRLRNELLWWRMAAFSDRLSRGYTELDPADVAIATALDLHEMVPPIAPIAVEHLLADLVRHVAGSNVGTPVLTLATAEQAGALPAASDDTPATLIDAIAGKSESPVVPAGQELTAERAAVLLFRDLQARRLVAQEPLEQQGNTK